MSHLFCISQNDEPAPVDPLRELPVACTGKWCRNVYAVQVVLSCPVPACIAEAHVHMYTCIHTRTHDVDK